jgi:hypothetical protein
MASTDPARQSRIIFFHKHGTSARTRFLRFADDTVCAFAPLPQLAAIIDESAMSQPPGIESHPALMLKEGRQRLQMPERAFEVEGEYRVWVDAPGGAIRVLLVRFTGIDPPFEAAAAIGARFIDLTQARDLPALELLLLRRAYEVILGG